MKYPIGIQNFEKLRTDGFTYVDKTALVYKLINEGTYYFLSRPRRFGKSLLISTLEAFFQGKRELFKGFAIDQLETEWIEHPILHLDLNSDHYDSPEVLRQRLNLALSQWERLYGRDENEATLSQRFEGVISRAHEQTGQRAVILVDEYDKPMLQALEDQTLKNQFVGILKAFYGVVKSKDRDICFALFTGVTKFSKVSVFSDLNNLIDLSLDEQYQSICGITEEELHTYFGESISALAKAYKTTDEDMAERLRRRYDGYHFVEDGIGIYNPFSLLNTFRKNKLGSYWFETGTPTYLVHLLQRDNFRLPNLIDAEVTGDVLNSVDSVENNPLPVIYQSGYLTIKSYDPEFDVYTLGFPNEEVEEGFMQFLMPFYTNIDKASSQFYIASFIKDLRTGHPRDFMKRMEAFFADTDYKVVGDTELYFQNIFFLLTKLLGFYTTVEKDTSDGRIDMVIETKAFIYIIEFKIDQTAAEALQQIDDKHYAAPYEGDGRQLYKIGINFSTERRCIDDWDVK